MEKVFSEPNLSKFDVRKLSDVKPPSSSKLDKEHQSQQSRNATKYDEEDYDCKFETFFGVFLSMTFLLYAQTLAHRKTSYPQSYVPIKAGRNMNRPTSKENNPTSTNKKSGDASTSQNSDGSDTDGGGDDNVSRPSNFSSYADYTSRDVSQEIDDDNRPPLSERVTTYHDVVNILLIIDFISYLYKKYIWQESSKKVQFNKGGRKQEQPEEDEEEKQRRKE